MFGFIIPLLAAAGLVYHTPATLLPATTNPKPVAIVFGAGLVGQKPSIVLQDRLDTAYSLYNKGLVSMILLSGDSTLSSHDEVGAMTRYLVAKGVPADSLLKDPQGLDTYQTCLHAKEQLSLKRAILVTQGFHMPRARYLCEGVGMKVIAGTADKREYDPKNAEREKQAMAKAWLQLNTQLNPDDLQKLEDIVNE